MYNWSKSGLGDTERPESLTATSEEPGAKAGGWQHQQGTCACPLHTIATKG